MNARNQGFRCAARSVLVVAASLVLAAATGGCSAPPGPEHTGQSDEDLVVHPHPVVTEIGAETGTPAANGALCGSYTIPVPAILDGYNCTLGVVIGYGSPIEDQAGYAFACDANVPLPSSLGLSSPLSTELFPQQTEEVTLSAAPTSCYGAPDSGYTIVLDMFSPYHIGNGGCRGPACDGIKEGK